MGEPVPEAARKRNAEPGTRLQDKPNRHGSQIVDDETSLLALPDQGVLIVSPLQAGKIAFEGVRLFGTPSQTNQMAFCSPRPRIDRT